ncbi:MAG: S9 family peptidase [Lawsonella sp.]
MDSLTPPRAARHPHVREFHGRRFVDDYEWMRDKNNPDTIAYLEAENAYTKQQTAHLKELQDTIFQEIKSRVKETDLSVPTRQNKWWHFARTEEGKAYTLICRVPAKPLDHPDAWEPPTLEPGQPVPGEEVLLDCNKLAEGHKFFALGGASVTTDGRYLGFLTDTTGDERYTLQVQDLHTGEMLPDSVTGVAPGMQWSPDGDYFFYQKVDAAWRPDSVWRHKVGTDPAEDVRVFYEPDERYWVGMGATRDDKYLSIVTSSKITTESWILEASNPAGEFECVRPREVGVEYGLDHVTLPATETTPERELFLIIHNACGPNSGVALADTWQLSDIASFNELPHVLEHQEDVRIDDVDAFQHHIGVSFRAAALPRVGIIPVENRPLGEGESLTDLCGEMQEIEVGEELFSIALHANPEIATPLLRISYGSYITPPTVADYRLSDGEIIIRKQSEVQGGYDRDRYEQLRLGAPARDGAKIPISLVRRRDVADNQPSPVLLYGYGSYESSQDPGFSISRLSYLDRGMTLAVAHVRGGGEMGRLWYEEGKLDKKVNTFYDFIDCADYLIAEGYTTPDQLVANGGSAGGLLMGAVANMAPDRFVAIEADVPFVDPLTSMLMPELPLTVIEWDEWGNPLEDPHIYDVMASYAPYENIKPQKYPAILATTSLNDTRVLYVEPAKWVAKLRAVAGDVTEREILLKTEMEAGHGGVSGRYARWEQIAFELAWILSQTGSLAVRETTS